MFNTNSTPIQCPIRDSAAKIRVDQSFAAKYSGMSCLTVFCYVLFEQFENENRFKFERNKDSYSVVYGGSIRSCN